MTSVIHSEYFRWSVNDVIICHFQLGQAGCTKYGQNLLLPPAGAFYRFFFDFLCGIYTIYIICYDYVVFLAKMHGEWMDAAR